VGKFIKIYEAFKRRSSGNAEAAERCRLLGANPYLPRIYPVFSPYLPRIILYNIPWEEMITASAGLEGIVASCLSIDMLSVG
jgi:hypothetical protein